MRSATIILLHTSCYVRGYLSRRLGLVIHIECQSVNWQYIRNDLFYLPKGTSLVVETNIVQMIIANNVTQW